MVRRLPQAETTTRIPPPLIGGTLLVTQQHLAVASDPDGDQIGVADLQQLRVLGTLRLQPGDEPGRLASDRAGNVHVVLRRGGAVISLRPSPPAILSRRAVCPAPRGIAYEDGADLLHVACAGGELVTLPASAGPPLRSVRPDRDLRDVLIVGGKRFVTRFRSVEVLEVDEDGVIVSGAVPMATPSVAVRAVPVLGEIILMLHQRVLSATLRSAPRGYYVPGSCGVGAVETALTAFAPRIAGTVPLRTGGVPLDMAVSPDDKQLVLLLVSASGPRLFTLETNYGHTCLSPTPIPDTEGATAVAYDPTGSMVAQLRRPFALLFRPNGPSGSRVLFSFAAAPLTPLPEANDGHALFHTPTPSGLACATCHPEGEDDGQVWRFDPPIGPRSTQSLRNNLLATAPFHWDGAFFTLGDLLDESFTRRMDGPSLSAAEKASFSAFLGALAPIPPSPAADPDAAARGGALFASAAVGCAGCHAGPRFTNNETLDVGTGRTFQVPSLLGVSLRMPLMHDGCVASLHGLFRSDPSCTGGERHGRTAHLSAAQIDDLVAYLETL